jgi:predicted  nucleic acid-binding Zn-ribbon protein
VNLAELEALKADLEKKIADFRSSKSHHSEKLVQEVSIAEGLRHTLQRAQAEIKKTTLEAEDKILDYQKTLLNIASLGRRL